LDLSQTGEENASNKVLAQAVNWGSFAECSGVAKFLEDLHGIDAEEQFKRCTAEGAAKVTEAVGKVLKIKQADAVTYVLTLFCEMGRTNAAAYHMLQPGKLEDALQGFLSRSDISTHAADCAANLLTAVFLHAGKADDKVLGTVVKGLMNKTYNVTEVGALDAIVNLLKSPNLRETVWGIHGVQEKITDFRSDSPVPVLYKCIFGVWMASCSKPLLMDLKNLGTIVQLRKIVGTSRTEKVIRVALMALKNLLEHPETAEEVVETGAHEAVEALEYEKWRDPEVYDAVKSVTTLVAKAVNDHSNFNRYEREIKSKKLSWGFIHSEKFWTQNFLAFEKDEFAVVKALVDVVSDDRADSTTLAVACHDIGEFARLHPSGKNVLARWPRAKAAVMERMGHNDREVAREALLCVQKLMLNRWQDLQKGE
jgi:V-type H+-transporting ATPase subunit H